MNVLSAKVAYRFFAPLILCLLFSVTGCTPEYTKKTGEDLAGRAGLADSVSIARGNQRMLSRQGQVCLLSSDAGLEQEQALLRTMQTAFSGYFVAVGVESAPLDYQQALSDPPCPAASYLFFVQTNDVACSNASACRNAHSDFIFTIVNRGDLSLLDRVQLSVRNSWLPKEGDQQARLQAAFEQLAAMLVGVGPS